VKNYDEFTSRRWIKSLLFSRMNWHLSEQAEPILVCWTRFLSIIMELLHQLNQLANIQVPEARQIVIQPWDLKILNDIVKAIQMSDLGINPNNDGKVIRLVFRL
jgi:hypothetical protein